MNHAIVGICFALIGLASACPADSAEPPAGVLYWEAERLSAAKALLHEESDDDGESADLRTAAKRLRKEADAALKRGPFSVTDNDGAPPSGDMHDYVSYSVYWWPDPDKSDGLPFIRRDGHTNHQQRAKGDREALKQMIDNVEALSLAYYFFERDEHAEHARRLLRVWFLDESTRMNPHLEFAQGIPGKEDGRGSGIIDSRAFVELLDSVELLDHAGALPRREAGCARVVRGLSEMAARQRPRKGRTPRRKQPWHVVRRPSRAGGDVRRRS